MHMRRSFSILGFVFVSAFCMTLAGCGGKEFSPEDFKKVEKGQDEAKVKEILGSPKDTLDMGIAKQMIWLSQDKYYAVVFAMGKVVETSGPMDKAAYEKMEEETKKAKEALQKMGDLFKK